MISPAETIDALQALTAIGFDDPSVFKSVLRATLIKRARDLEVFDALFPLYFYSLEEPEEVEPLDERRREWVEEALEAMLDRVEGAMNSFFFLLLFGEAGEWEAFIQEVASRVGTAQLATRAQIGMYTRRIYDSFDWEGLEQLLQMLLERLEEMGWNPEELAGLREAFEKNREAFRAQVRRYVSREQARNLESIPRRERMDRLLRRPLTLMDENELQLVREAVHQLARKLRNKISLRERQNKRGKLDVRATLRKNMQHGGIPFKLVLKRKRMEKVELMVLCDVSSSVSRVSQFMLQFVYHLQDCLAKVRSFVFVDELGEVTEFFREADIEEGVCLALTAADIAYYARSDFGAVFRSFCENYLQDVGYRTYILIIGDARNNENDPQAWALEKMAERAKGIIWLNPETKPYWDTGDSVMGDYLPYLREARVCRNLQDLEETVSSLLL
jgi:hypothetical protein